jgi:dipeptidyl-peptidase-4
MKNLFSLLFVCFYISISFAQSLTSIELLDKSIQYHDPNNRWKNFKATLHFEQRHPMKTEQRFRTTIFDRSRNYFKFIQTTDDEILIREADGENCNNLYNGSTKIPEEVNKKHRFTCERAKMYRDYYEYLYGLPMKLKDQGTIIDPLVKDEIFNGRSVYSIRVTYEKNVGEDIWYFYFDKKSYALIGYRFFHDESKKDGEYISLYGEEIVQGIKIPKNRFWFYNKDDKFLVADLLLPEAGNAVDEDLMKEDYDRAISFGFNNLMNKEIFNLNIRTNWFSDSTGFWFEQHSPEGKKYQQFLTKDLEITALFDHQKVTELLNKLGKDSLKANSLSLQYLEYLNNDTLKFVYKNKHYHLSRNDYILQEIEVPKTSNPMESTSPDGKWKAFTKDYNLYIKSTETEQEYQLSNNGKKHFEYASYVGWADIMEGENGDRPEKFYINWSPDSRYLQANICDLRYADKMYLLDWSVDTLFRPRLLSYYRGSPGDTTMIHYIPVFYDISSKREITNTLPRNTHINSINFTWSDESGKIYAQYSDRGYQKERIELIDLKNKTSKILLTETSETNIDYFPVRYLEKKNLFLFISERSGWRQLYSYHLKDQKINRITQGDFYINSINRIDEEKGRIYFMGSGKEAENNPYHQQLYRIDIGGQNFTLLTPENAHHQVSVSSDGKYFVDNFSTVTSPTTTVLRSTKNGDILKKIANADVSRLYKKGYMLPQPFEAIGRDGETKIYGALWKPSNFDPSKKYPIIDHSYTGPHTQVYPKSFVEGIFNQALAELGFIIIEVDGMGSSGRSKYFHNHSYKNMGMNLKCHVLAIQQLGKRFSWLDTDRVGIFGHSAGGYDAGHAVLQFPDFYKVAVASSADHDFRMEKAWWPEMYMGWPVDSTYHHVSNITMAGNLKGKLLLVNGGLDDNVNPSATFKLAEALVNADKEFDLLILPSQRHGYKDQQHWRYFTKKRWNYFVEYLLGKTPIWDLDWLD